MQKYANKKTIGWGILIGVCYNRSRLWTMLQ